MGHKENKSQTESNKANNDTGMPKPDVIARKEY